MGKTGSAPALPSLFAGKSGKRCKLGLPTDIPMEKSSHSGMKETPTVSSFTPELRCGHLLTTIGLSEKNQKRKRKQCHLKNKWPWKLPLTGTPLSYTLKICASVSFLLSFDLVSSRNLTRLK